MGGGCPTLISQLNPRLFLHGHTIQTVFSYSSVEIKKKIPSGVFEGSKYPNFSIFNHVSWPYFSMDHAKNKQG